jgi:hypothetical protein
MKGFRLLSLALATLVCCRSEVVVLAEPERALVGATGIGEAVLLQVKRTGRKLRQLEGTDADGNTVKLTGVSVDVPHTEATVAVLLAAAAARGPPRFRLGPSVRHRRPPGSAICDESGRPLRGYTSHGQQRLELRHQP